MANVYESKFKGVEVDEGVNIARNLAGTGGIDIRTFGTGINTVKKIDGSILMTALGEKQDTLTVSSNVHINSLTADYITLGSSGSISLYPQSGAGGNAYLPKYGGYLATTGDIPAVVPITGTGTTYVMSQKAVTDELGKKQDKITDQTSLNVGSLKIDVGATGTYAQPGRIEISGTPASIFICDIRDNYGTTIKPYSVWDDNNGDAPLTGPVTVILPNKSGTLALTSDITTAINDLKISETGGAYTVPKANSVGTINVNGVNADGIDSTAVTVADYANAPHNLTQLEGDRLSFYYGADPYDGNICNLLAPAGNVTGAATYNIKLPQKSGTVALLSDITGGGSAGVSSIGGTTGAITLSTGLAMSGQQLVNKVKVYTSGNYLCIDTN